MLDVGAPVVGDHSVWHSNSHFGPSVAQCSVLAGILIVLLRRGFETQERTGCCTHTQNGETRPPIVPNGVRPSTPAHLRRFRLIAKVVCLAAASWVAESGGICGGVELPKMEDISAGHISLRDTVRKVQGSIQIFRDESIHKDAIEDSSDATLIPLQLSGVLWRDGERFRADITRFGSKESRHSYAVDAGKVYEFSSSPLTESGMLRICDVGTQEAQDAMRTIEALFLSSLDAAWSVGGAPLVDLLQRTNTELIPNTFPALTGGVALSIVPDGKLPRVEYQLNPGKYFGFGYQIVSQEAGKLRISVERRVLSREKAGNVFPRRITQISSSESDGVQSGYTEVVLLDLETLQPGSPVSGEIASESFKNFGIGYQVYKFETSNREQLAERIQKANVLYSLRSESRTRRYLIWLNIVVVLGVVSYLIVKRVRRANV